MKSILQRLMNILEKMNYKNTIILLVMLFIGCSNNKSKCICCLGDGYIRGSQLSMVDKNGEKTYYEFTIPCRRCNQKEYESYRLEEIEIDKVVYN